MILNALKLPNLPNLKQLVVKMEKHLVMKLLKRRRKKLHPQSHL